MVRVDVSQQDLADIAPLNAEILAWSRSKGLFAGISLKGAVLRPDEKENADLYGHSMTNKDILAGTMTVPDNARSLGAELSRYSSNSSADRVKK